MKKFLLILVFGIFHYQLFAQTAEDALSEFDWLTNYVERNYPGYKYGWEESPTNKKASEIRMLFLLVGVDGFEPPTLCL